MSVIGFVARRLLWVLPVLWAAVTLLFLVFYVLPGNRVGQVLSGDRLISPALQAATAHRLGLDRSLPVQYGRYWEHVLQGDFGRSFTSGRSVSAILAEVAPASLRLAFWAVLLEAAVGIVLGTIAARAKWFITRFTANGITVVLLATPVFVLGAVLQLLFGIIPFQHNWPTWTQFPVQGIGTDSWAFWVVPTGDQWRYLCLPVLCLAAVSSASVARLMRSSLAQAMQSGYVQGARARGIPERKVLLHHGIRTALTPVLTFLGVDFANLAGAAVLTETVFNWPGLGSTAAQALRSADAPVILGLTLVVVLLAMAANLVADVIHRLLDPRITAEVTQS